ncbi:Rossmann-like and DUF2520 domain-containing protein [Novosphingobium sp. BL-52-GroH]|uniref:Rossmann-like and DUF2520 domain-containing protein n=1 Tax=Novosphingobium sp. BL-52-GroH TaxID=3349877 RepID=UPI0038504F91
MTDSPIIQRLGIVGTGRAARAFAVGLGPHSASPPAVWGRDPAKREHAAFEIGRSTPFEDLPDLASACDVIIIAVADDAIPTIVEELARAWPTGRASLAFHLSGRSGAAILAPLHERGARTAAVHPAMTFTGDPRIEVERMAGAHFAVTASSGEATDQAHALVRALGGLPFDIDEQQRTLYHAALSHGANHLVTLLAGAMRALRAAGAAEPGALLAPLVRAALENSLERGMGALSGPVLRGDAETISGHLAALQADCPELLGAYCAMAAATIDELERQGSPHPRAAIRAILKRS